MERVTVGADGQDARPVVFVDYAHTEHALRSLLDWLGEIATGCVRLVFGCGGDRDPGRRPRMGRVASRIADHVIVTSDNPRSEEPLAIIRDIMDGFYDLDGRIPCQVDGGLKCFGHPIGASGLRMIYATRQLAKRQITWLRRETSALWYDPRVSGARESVIAEIARFLDS